MFNDIIDSSTPAAWMRSEVDDFTFEIVDKPLSANWEPEEVEFPENWDLDE